MASFLLSDDSMTQQKRGPEPHDSDDRPSAPWLRLLAAGLLALALALLAWQLYRVAWAGFAGKTLWDWMDLLIVPIVLAIGGWLLNRSEKEREEQVTARREAINRDIATDTQRETTLQTYFDRMSDLLLTENLRGSEEKSEVRAVARVWTLTVLRRMDRERKVIVLRFLYEADLIHAGRGIVNLNGADFARATLAHINLAQADLHRIDLTGASLFEAYLRNADLRGATLRAANLRGAKLYNAALQGADLRSADLTGAKLKNVSLQGANLRGAQVTEQQLAEARSLRGTIMPDGSQHL